MQTESQRGHSKSSGTRNRPVPAHASEKSSPSPRSSRCGPHPGNNRFDTACLHWADCLKLPGPKHKFPWPAHAAVKPLPV